VQLPYYDGYFWYYVYKDCVKYVCLDEWDGDGERYLSHQEFYDQFHSQKEGGMGNGVIEFLVTNKLVKA